MKDDAANGFDDLMHEFQGIDTPSVSLVTAVERGRARLLRARIVGLLTAVLLWGVSLRTLLGHPDAADIYFAAVQMALPVVLTIFIRRSSRNTWRARSETTRGFLELELERCRDRIRRMRFMRVLLPAMAVTIVIHQVMLVEAHPDIRFLGFVGYALPYTILAGLYWHSARRRVRYEAEAEDIAGRILSLDAPEQSMQI